MSVIKPVVYWYGRKEHVRRLEVPETYLRAIAVFVEANMQKHPRSSVERMVSSLFGRIDINIMHGYGADYYSVESLGGSKGVEVPHSMRIRVVRTQDGDERVEASIFDRAPYFSYRTEEKLDVSTRKEAEKVAASWHSPAYPIQNVSDAAIETARRLVLRHIAMCGRKGSQPFRLSPPKETA